VYIYKNICPVLITFGKISDYLFERILKELDMSRHREDQILKELEESRRREEGTQRLLKTLTEEVFMLRGEVRQLKSLPVPEPVANNLQMLPFETLPDFQDFDQKLLNEDETRRELVIYLYCMPFTITR